MDRAPFKQRDSPPEMALEPWGGGHGSKRLGTLAPLSAKDWSPPFSPPTSAERLKPTHNGHSAFAPGRWLLRSFSFQRDWRWLARTQRSGSMLPKKWIRAGPREDRAP